MHRRTALALCGSVLPTVLAGCTESRPVRTSTESSPTADSWDSEIPDSQPAVDCSSATTPSPAPPEQRDVVQPRDYPGEPPHPLVGQAVVQYTIVFERALQYNQRIVMHRRRNAVLERFSMTIQNSWVSDELDTATVVRLQYIGSGNVRDEDGVVSNFDLVPQFVTYYIDPSIVVRARKPMIDDTTALDPNPWTDGQPLVCFDQ